MPGNPSSSCEHKLRYATSSDNTNEQSTVVFQRLLRAMTRSVLSGQLGTFVYCVLLTGRAGSARYRAEAKEYAVPFSVVLQIFQRKCSIGKNLSKIADALMAGPEKRVLSCDSIINSDPISVGVQAYKTRFFS